LLGAQDFHFAGDSEGVRRVGAFIMPPFFKETRIYWVLTKGHSELTPFRYV